MNEEIYTSKIDVQAFEKVHGKLRRPIEQYLYYLTGTTQGFDDLAQEVFIKLWINWSKLGAMKFDDLKDYVFIIIRNYIINETREQRRPKRNRSKFLKEYRHTHFEHYWHDEVLVTEGIRLHHQAVDQLPKKLRVVYLSHVYGYEAGEIAAILNKSKSTVHNQLTDAYKTVKAYLNKNYGWNLSEKGRRNCWQQASLN